MKQSIRISMLVSTLMLNVSNPLFAAQPAPTAPQVVNAWYGAENNSANKNVTKKLQDVVKQYGVIKIPAEQNKFYSFDPIPGVKKTTAIHVKYMGKDQHLRAPEGTDFVFPADVDKAKVQQALAEVAPAVSAQAVSFKIGSIELPISKQELEQEVIKAAGGGTPQRMGSILLPVSNGSKGPIIVSGITTLPGKAFIMKFISDEKGVYSIDRTFGRNVAPGRNPKWKAKNGIIFVWGGIEEAAGFINICLLPGDKSGEFRVKLILVGEINSNCATAQGGTAVMNDRGDVISTEGLDYHKYP